ncbi:MAG: hypothetical protein ACK5P4_04170 [Bacteroidota bacterium]|jgi:hypothetical protein
MKKLKIKFCGVLLKIILSSTCLLGQEIDFKCDVQRFKDNFGDDKAWNDLLMKACDEINSKQYNAALITLREAIYRDSVASNGIITQYIQRQYIKLRSQMSEQISNISNNIASPKSDLPINNNEIKNNNKETDKQDLIERQRLIDEEKTKEEINTREKKRLEEEREKAIQEEEARVKAENEAKELERQKRLTEEENYKKQKELEELKRIELEKNQTNIIDEGKKIFTDAELQDFQTKGINKVKQLESYIQQISNKSTANNIALSSTENAIRLFDSEERKVQVTSIKNPAGVRIKIRSYLNKLRMMNYENVDIKWADFLYTSEFRKGDDGNYYGYITFQQRFVGMVDNMVKYQDVTTKKQQIILKYYEKAINGEAVANWDVFLGDISVEQTSEN